MKIQRAVICFLLAGFLAGSLSCSIDIFHSEDDEPSAGKLCQVPGCENEGLNKPSFRDSCFSYSFDQHLNIDFCVYANCCPDSNRFALGYEIRQDSIIVAVQDTAARLCRCICAYLIQAEFTTLHADKYIFYCQYDDSLLTYAEEVRRSHPK